MYNLPTIRAIYKILWSETRRGKTLARTLQNYMLSQVHITGTGIDLGAGEGKSSYHRFLQKNDATITSADLYSNNIVIDRIDLEQTLPMQSESQDFILLANTLEHIYNYQNLVNESYRLLKNGSPLIGTVPYLKQVHMDPDDFFRYTESALKRMFTNAGFTTVEVYPIGFGPFTAGISQYGVLLKIKPVIYLSYLTAFLLDSLYQKFFPKNRAVQRTNFPLNYFFYCVK